MQSHFNARTSELSQSFNRLYFSFSFL